MKIHMHVEEDELTKDRWEKARPDNLAQVGMAFASALWRHAYYQERIILDKEQLEWLINEFLEFEVILEASAPLIEELLSVFGTKPIHPCKECDEE